MLRFVRLLEVPALLFAAYSYFVIGGLFLWMRALGGIDAKGFSVMLLSFACVFLSLGVCAALLYRAHGWLVAAGLLLIAGPWLLKHVIT